jgi:protein TonB
MIVRGLIAAFGAVLVTLGLFVAMWARIAQSEMVLDDYERRGPIEFVRLRQDSQTQTKKRELPKLQRPEPPPEAPDMDMPEASGPGATSIAAGTPRIDTGLNLRNAFKLGSGPASNEAVPIVRVEPMYPRRAREQFIEGWVLVAFDITPTGKTANVRVVDSDPPRIFDRAAVQAVKKWKYRPTNKTTKNQKVRFPFQLDD